MDNTPVCTYRLQLSASVKLSRVTHLVPYFQALGVSHLHLSPLHTARPGSFHGYDVVSHSSLNPEIGTEADLQDLSDMLASRNMGLILDLVPNHMCIASPLNLQWQDVLENGKDAASARFFDIDWGPPKAQLVNKVLLPVLGAQFGHELEQSAVQVIEHGGVFQLTYGKKIKKK